MKLKKMTVENFRGYKEPTSILFNDLTTFIGPNDIGKSTVLEALDIFFNDGKGVVKLDKKDINVDLLNENSDVKITLVFTDLPEKIIIDTSNETELEKEFLLNKDGDFEVEKVFKNAATTVTAIKVYIKAKHPTNTNCKDLLLKKNTDLKKIVEQLKLDCDKTKNATMRSAIWQYYESDLQLNETSIDVASKDGDIKAVWTKIQNYLPHYSLFQSDRKNCDTDDEVQDPLKEAVKQILSDSELQSQLNQVAEKVKEKLQEVADLTLEKINEMNPEVANSLHPNIPSPEALKWADVFKGLSISGDGDIPINKRGSGVRRLILLNFFRAEAERKKTEKNSPSIIYAIEEPETSQHIQHQIKLVAALKALAERDGIQVILTTHSSDIVKKLSFSDLRLLSRDKDSNKVEVMNVEKKTLPYPSLNEVNYVAFGDASEEFHNELYGFLQAKATAEDSGNEKEKEFEKWLLAKGAKLTKNWIRIVKGTPLQPYDVTLQTFIRNSMHHPENTENQPYSAEELKSSIIEMIKILKSLSINNQSVSTNNQTIARKAAVNG